MKMIRRPKSRNKVWISTWIVVGVLLVAAFIKYGAPAVAEPFLKVGASVNNVGAAAVGIFSSKSSIEAENLQLKDQLAQVQVEKDQNKLLLQENLQLKELLGRHSNNSSILATILAKPPISLYDTVVIDVGSGDGVVVGDTALALGLVPIGKITTVYLHTSIVALYSSSGQKIDVLIGKNIQTSATAQSGGNFLIELPKGTEIAKGDVVSAPGINAKIFGHVESIEIDENDPFIYVRFSLPVNMSELHFLQIDRNEK